jgi:hypothetical protein
MASSTYGRKLNPYRRLREPLGVKGIRQTVTITNNPSTIDQNQQLLVRFPNLGPHDLIVPGTARLAFKIALDSTDPNRTVVQNLGRAIIKKTTVRISGNEILSIDDCDVYHCYHDLWRTPQERANGHYQGIDTTPKRNATKLRVAADDGVATNAAHKAIADYYTNRFYVPLDFELLESTMPYYQSGLGDRLEYELTFNNYDRVIIASSEATYAISDLCLEFDQVTMPDLARTISYQYSGRLPILYERVLRARRVVKNASDTLWNININTPARSMKGILMLFEAPAEPFQRDSEVFYNPKIDKVEVCIEGLPNQLYSAGMRMHHQWDEARRFFAGGSKRHPETNTVVKDLHLADVSQMEFLTSKFCLWLDLRTTDDDNLHGSGRSVENAAEGITIQISKEAEEDRQLNVYIFIVMDAILQIENGRYLSAVF